MKSFENCNVAVCLSGQSRTFVHCHKSINDFFSSNRGNKFFFFGHTWDNNTYKIKNDDEFSYEEEKLNVAGLRAELLECFNFEKLVVEEQKNFIEWDNILYSVMRSNFLKQQYEAENNMMFDLVIKARFDVCYEPGDKFENMFTSTIEEKSLYSKFGIMNCEFALPNPDDVMYFGSSLTMDLIDSFFNCSGEKFGTMVGSNYDNLAFRRVGMGVLLYKWMTIKNILPIDIVLNYAIIRKQSCYLEHNKDWDKLKRMGYFVDL